MADRREKAGKEDTAWRRWTRHRSRLWMLAGGIVVVVVAFIAVLAAALSSGDEPSVSAPATVSQIQAGRHILGSEDALVTVVEFSDFQ